MVVLRKVKNIKTVKVHHSLWRGQQHLHTGCRGQQSACSAPQSSFSLCTSLGASTKSCPLNRMMVAVMALAAPQNTT